MKTNKTGHIRIFYFILFLFIYLKSEFNPMFFKTLSMIIFRVLQFPTKEDYKGFYVLRIQDRSLIK